MELLIENQYATVTSVCSCSRDAWQQHRVEIYTLVWRILGAFYWFHKDCFKVSGRASVSLETLKRVVTEIEAILNDRPLTYVSSDPDDLQPFTPTHMLYGRSLTLEPC